LDVLKTRVSKSGVSSRKSKFYPPHSSTEKDLAFYKKKLQCFDYEGMAQREDIVQSLEIQGDFNSPKARTLKLMFEKCDNATRPLPTQRRALQDSAASSNDPGSSSISKSPEEAEITSEGVVSTPTEDDAPVNQDE